jgi:hypothetical protein
MASLAALMAGADPGMQPSPDQWVQFGDRRVRMWAALDRTVVIEFEGQRVLVRLDQIEVEDPSQLRWENKPGDSRQQTVYAAKRRAQQRKQARDAELR